MPSPRFGSLPSLVAALGLGACASPAATGVRFEAQAAPPAAARVDPAPVELPTLEYLRTEIRLVSDGNSSSAWARDVFELRNDTAIAWSYKGFGPEQPHATLCLQRDGEWQPCTFYFCITGETEQMLPAGARVEFGLTSTGRDAIGELELRSVDGVRCWTIQSRSYTPPSVVSRGRSNRERDLPSLARAAFKHRCPCPPRAGVADGSAQALAPASTALPQLRYLRTQVVTGGGGDEVFDVPYGDADDVFELVNTTDRTWRYRANDGVPRDAKMEARFGDAWSREATFTLCGNCWDTTPFESLEPGARIEFSRNSVGRLSRCSIDVFDGASKQATVLTSAEYLPTEHWLDGKSQRNRGSSSRQADGFEYYIPFFSDE